MPDHFPSMVGLPSFDGCGGDEAFGGFLFEAELAAGGIDVVAFFEAEGGGDAGVFEDIAKGAAAGVRGADPVETLDGVVGDEVDFGVEAAGVAGEDGGLFEVVVDAVDEDVFEGELLVFTGVPVVERVKEFGDGPPFVDWHDLLADVVGGAVEGDGEANLLGVLGELADLWDEAGGGECEVACAEVEGFGAGDELDGGEEVFEVGEGFSHAHEDEVVDALAGELFGGEDLAGDFGGVEVAGEAGEAGGAEFAAVCAADLGGDAEGAAVRGFAVEGGVCGDEDAFDVAAVVEFEEEFAGGVRGALGGGVGEGC